jgi:hypothetical protein
MDLNVDEYITLTINLAVIIGLLLAGYFILLALFAIWYFIWIEIKERRHKE